MHPQNFDVVKIWAKSLKIWGKSADIRAQDVKTIANSMKIRVKWHPKLHEDFIWTSSQQQSS